MWEAGSGDNSWGVVGVEMGIGSDVGHTWAVGLLLVLGLWAT